MRPRSCLAPSRRRTFASRSSSPRAEPKRRSSPTPTSTSPASRRGAARRQEQSSLCGSGPRRCPRRRVRWWWWRPSWRSSTTTRSRSPRRCPAAPPPPRAPRAGRGAEAPTQSRRTPLAAVATAVVARAVLGRCASPARPLARPPAPLTPPAPLAPPAGPARLRGASPLLLPLLSLPGSRTSLLPRLVDPWCRSSPSHRAASVRLQTTSRPATRASGSARCARCARRWCLAS